MAFGADYIENILYQDMTPTRVHPNGIDLSFLLPETSHNPLAFQWN
jgi:hypothetical protein